MDLNYYSIRELLDSAKKEGLPLSSLVLTQQAEQLELTEEEEDRIRQKNAADKFWMENHNL